MIEYQNGEEARERVREIMRGKRDTECELLGEIVVALNAILDVLDAIERG